MLTFIFSAFAKVTSERALLSQTITITMLLSERLKAATIVEHNFEILHHVADGKLKVTYRNDLT